MGLGNEITQILDTITGRASNLQIVPITGMGGIGKTTLARAVYDDSRTLHHFDVRFWVTISQEYDVRAVLRGLLPFKQQTEHPDDILVEHVYKNLKGRRFLIVLDDMWHGKAWDGVMNAFPDDNNGSRIILTTRELGVVSYVGSLSNVHHMQLLNEDQSWIMLREKVYRQEPCPTDLEGIGRMISNNCKGLPLAIVVIAGLLKLNKTKKYWEEVAENTKAVETTDYDHLFEILSLSYTNLPPQLKACFLYMGSFPEDYEFPTKELAMLWTAEGFLKPSESYTVEEIAEECLEELVERCLVLVKKYNKKYYGGKIKTTFSIHDVLREVSIRKAKEEMFLSHYSTSPVEKIIKDRHRKSFYKNDLIKFQSGTYDAHVRSFRYEFFGGSRFPSALCNLTSLRYLHVHGKGFDITFPKSISKLQNLETLIIKYWTGRSVLPLDIWKLSRLRHFILGSIWTRHSPSLDSQGVLLENLQTLCGVSDINFSMDAVERNPNVRKLRLVYRFVSFDYWQEYSLSNLQHLHQLEVLSIRCWEFHGDFSLSPSTELAFPQNLKKLSLFGTKIPLENLMSVVGSLPNLEVLKLIWDSIVGEIWEPIEGDFLQLKYLKMDDLEIQEWRAESIHFPCLKKLQIISCTNLKEVPECIGEIDTLEELVLVECPRAEESVQKIRENQQAFGNDSLKITIDQCD